MGWAMFLDASLSVLMQRWDYEQGKRHTEDRSWA